MDTLSLKLIFAKSHTSCHNRRVINERHIHSITMEFQLECCLFLKHLEMRLDCYMLELGELACYMEKSENITAISYFKI